MRVPSAILLALTALPLLAGESSGEKQPKLPPLHHLVDIPIPEDMKVDSALPMNPERELKCPVCHGIEDIDRRDFDKVDKKDPKFLHGGPYRKLTTFCFRCHDEETHRRNNIHVMLDDRGEIIEEKCKYCHQEVLKRDRAHDLREIKLRAPVDTLCYGCHLKTPHLNALEHQVEPSEKVEKQRSAFLEEHPEVILPLTGDGKVTCITCHTPHPPGILDKSLAASTQVTSGKVEEGPVYRESPWGQVIEADKQARLKQLSDEFKQPLEYHYRQIEKEALLRLPAKNGQLCRTCHVFED